MLLSCVEASQTLESSWILVGKVKKIQFSLGFEKYHLAPYVFFAKEKNVKK